MKISQIIQKALQEHETRFAFELLPPLKGENITTIFDAVDALMSLKPAYINVTHHREDLKFVDLPDGTQERRIIRRRPGTIGISAALAARYNVEVVPHLICGSMSRYSIEEALIEMDFLGFDNVFALRGDAIKGEKVFNPHPEGYAHATQMVQHISHMNQGIYSDSEVENCHPTNFCIGVAGYPEKHADAPDLQTDIHWLREKVNAGADYIVTQLFFDNAKYFNFVELCHKAGINVPIVPGIKPFTSKAQLELLPRIFGVELPEELRRQVEKCNNNEEVRHIGIDWAIRQTTELKAAHVPVIHFYTMGRSESTLKIGKQIF